MGCTAVVGGVKKKRKKLLAAAALEERESAGLAGPFELMLGGRRQK